MTHTKQECCESCDGNLYPTYGNGCLDSSCPCHTSVEPKSRAELVEEIVGKMVEHLNSIYVRDRKYTIADAVDNLRSSLIRISDASMDAVEVEERKYKAPEIDREDWFAREKQLVVNQGRDVTSGWNAARAASQEKRKEWTRV